MAKRRSSEDQDDSLTSFQNAMNNLLNDIFTPVEDHSWLGPQSSGYVPLIDVAEGDEDYWVTVEVPGLDEQSLRIAVRRNTLVVEGNKSMDADQGDRRFRHTERVYGFFRRNIPIPEGVDSRNVSARMRHGVLTILMPKLAA
jgi:HSP20 family protein